MRIAHALATIALVSIPILSGCRSGSSASDFTGAWSGKASVINSSGSGEASHDWDLVADPTGRMTGNVSYRIPGEQTLTGTDAEGKTVRSDSEQVIGMIDYDTGTFIMVETDELGTIFGELLDDGRIRIMQSQPGPQPVVVHLILSRQAH